MPDRLPDSRRIYPIFLENGGCDERCSYCAQQRSARGTGIDPAAAARRLEAMLPQQGGGEIAFYGGSFTRLPVSLQEALLEFATAQVQAGRADAIRISTRPDALDSAALKRLAAAAVCTVELGCQSFSPQVLAACNRNYAPSCVAESVAALRDQRLRVGLQLMPGLPGGDACEAFDSLAQALALHPDFLRIYPALVLSGTPLAAAWQRGDYRPWSLSRTIRDGAQLLARAHADRVPVIRFGLQMTPELEANLLDGPYHPALGQLVRARLWYEALKGLACGAADRVGVHRADLSDARGYRRRNLRSLHRLGRGEIVVAEQVPRGYYGWRNKLYQVPGLFPAGE